MYDQWVSFFVGEELFACPVTAVREIMPYREPVPVPGGPQEVEGILNVRGEIVPVVSGSSYVGSEVQGELERILIFESEEGSIGVSVNQVGHILPVDEQDIDRGGQLEPPLLGTVLTEGRIVVLVKSPAV